VADPSITTVQPSTQQQQGHISANASLLSASDGFFPVCSLQQEEHAALLASRANQLEQAGNCPTACTFTTNVRRIAAHCCFCVRSPLYT
jgi:hypothetical protein